MLSPRGLISMVPGPRQAADVVKRVIELVPGLPGGGEPPPRAQPAPPRPAPVPKAAKPKPAGPQAAKPKPAKAKAKPPKAKPKTSKAKAKAKPSKAQANGREPHHALNNPVGDPDLTEYPDPYEKREDPRDPVVALPARDGGGEALTEEPRSEPGAVSTSEPHPDHDPEAEELREKRRRDRLDQ
jgi:hypothetical protein